MINHRLLCTAGAILALVSSAVRADAMSSTDIDELVNRVQKEFNVPGLAVGVIDHGKVVHAKGYGLLRIDADKTVNTQTLFKIASNTKAFTAAALALLVQDGKLQWQDRLVQHMPEFALYDPWVTSQFTVVDMLTHRSGLGLGAGDLMLWPEPSGFSRDEVVHNLRFLPGEAASFRREYAYDNLMYILAGQLVERLSGLAWEDFVEKRIMQPLAMDHCAAGKVPETLQQNQAIPHKVVEGELQIVIRDTGTGPLVSAAAGGIQCSLQDMLTWARMLLKEGVTDSGNVLLDSKQIAEMWSPQTIMSVGRSSKQNDQTHFAAYALGWRLHDYLGYLRVHHTGALAGMRAHTSLFPERDFAVIVLLNKGSSRAREAIMQTITQRWLGGDETQDWVAQNKAAEQRRSANTTELREQIKADFNWQAKGYLATDYTGQYLDNWFGKIRVWQEQGKLVIQSEKMIKLLGELQPVSADRFFIYWYDRSMHADAHAQFVRDAKGKVTGLLIEPQEDIDWSFDFQDLNLQKLPH